jgi:ADP-heptose:LPS heptosyltransferase
MRSTRPDPTTSDPADGSPPWREVAVIRALRGLGDMLCVVPTLRRIRAGVPDARLTCVGVPAGRWLLERFPELIDDWIDLPSWPSIPEAEGDPDDTIRMLAARAGTFDLVVQAQGSGGQINRLAEALSRDAVVAHVQPDEHVLPTGGHRWFTRPWPEVGHEAERLADLVAEVGFPTLPVRLEFPVRADDVRQLPRALAQPGGRPVAVVHPGASRADRRWSTDGFTAVARHLHHLGMQVVITGTAPELAVVGAVADGCSVVPWVLIDAPLGGTAALLRAATVLVANDTGVAHLGVAVDVPTLVVGTTSDLERWAPVDRRRHDAIRTTGHTPVDLQLVLARLDALLERTRGAIPRLAAG